MRMTYVLHNDNSYNWVVHCEGNKKREERNELNQIFYFYFLLFSKAFTTEKARFLFLYEFSSCFAASRAWYGMCKVNLFSFLKSTYMCAYIFPPYKFPTVMMTLELLEKRKAPRIIGREASDVEMKALNVYTNPSQIELRRGKMEPSGILFFSYAPLLLKTHMCLYMQTRRNFTSRHWFGWRLKQKKSSFWRQLWENYLSRKIHPFWHYLNWFL